MARYEERQQLKRELKRTHNAYVRALRAAYNAEEAFALAQQNAYKAHVMIRESLRDVGVQETAPALPAVIVDYLSRNH